MMVHVQIGDLLINQDSVNKDIPLEYVHNYDINVGLEVPSDGKYYTLILYENLRYGGHGGHFIHLFGYNIHNGDIQTGEYPFVIDYNEFEESILYFELYLQPSRLVYDTVLWDRHDLSIEDVTKYDTLVDRLIVTVGDSLDVNKGHHDFFKTDTKLSEQEKKYCSCLVKVVNNGGADNPYAVCAHTVGSTTKECTSEYDFNKMPDNLLNAYAKLHKLQVYGNRSRSNLLQSIHNKF